MKTNVFFGSGKKDPESNESQIDKNSKTKKWPMVLLWIFFLPIMVIVYIAKNEKIEKKKKIVYIALILVLSIGILAYSKIQEQSNAEKDLAKITTLFENQKYTEVQKQLKDFLRDYPNFNNLDEVKALLELTDQKISTEYNVPAQKAPASIPKIEKPAYNEFMNLTKDEEKYLIFLENVAKAYPDNSLSEDDFNKLNASGGPQKLVEQVLSYKYDHNTLHPDFVSSFSMFWNEDIAEREPQISELLYDTFTLTYDFKIDRWQISAPVSAIIGSTKEQAIALLTDYILVESYYQNLDPDSITFENNKLRIIVDFDKYGIAEGVYMESLNTDEMDIITLKGSYVSLHYDELVMLATGGNPDIEVESDLSLYNQSGIKKYPGTLIIGNIHE